jgi:hypothetical protein
VPYVAGLGIVGGTYVALTVQGWYALCTFCGEDLTLRLFSDQNWARPSYVIRMLFGLQTIPLWLLASRIRYFDSVLPFIPLVFIEQDNVAIYPTPRLTLLPTPRYETFPPALTMCILPWLRVVYNKLWDTFVKPIERKWDDTSDRNPTNQGEENEIVVRWRGGEQQEAQPEERQAPIRNRRNNRNNNQQVEAAADVIVHMSGTQLCRKLLGAMLLPDACSLAGFLLGQLPWVRRKIPDRFSRNVIGGILFLVLKVFSGLIWLTIRMLHRCGSNTRRSRVGRLCESWIMMPAPEDRLGGVEMFMQQSVVSLAFASVAVDRHVLAYSLGFGRYLQCGIELLRYY